MEENKGDSANSQGIAQKSMPDQAMTKGSGSHGNEEEQFVVFNLGDEEFGVSISEVLEITKLKDITRVPNSDENIEGAINLRGRIHVVFNLAKKLGFPIKKLDENSRIIITETDDGRVGMLVDSVAEVLRVSKKNLKEAPEIISHKINDEFISGVIIIEKRLIILLNLLKSLVEEKNPGATEALKNTDADSTGSA